MEKIFFTILRIALAFVITFGISKVIKIKAKKENKMHVLFLENLFIIVAWLIAVFFALYQIPIFDKTWEALITSSGILTAILGLAAQSSLTNIFAGISISIGKNKPFEIGDRIKIGQYDAGYVKNISLRQVEIETYFHQTIFIPNKTVNENIIINYTKEDNSSYPVEISIAYESDIDKAIEIFQNVISKYPKCYNLSNNGPVVLCKEAQDSGILLRATITTKDFDDIFLACSDILKEVIKEYKKQDIEIPYNKLEVHQK